jgi:hypothetical protein
MASIVHGQVRDLLWQQALENVAHGRQDWTTIETETNVLSPERPRPIRSSSVMRIVKASTPLGVHFQD